MKYKKDQITFSTKYKKLEDIVFHTVRWLDSVYIPGNIYDVVTVYKNIMYNRKILGQAELFKIEVGVLGDLLADKKFILNDAECTPKAFFKLMERWYKLKPNWYREQSKVQVLWFRYVRYDEKEYTETKQSKLLKKEAVEK